MPTFKGVTVEIHCPKIPPADPENFSWTSVEHGATKEYGTHRLRHTPKMTSYIAATTNCPFAVSIAILDSYEPKVKGDDKESLAAYVYFDGKQKEETATLLRRGVETWISSRWIEVEEGKLAEREFVFREVGLENFFTSLDISKDRSSELEGASVNRRHSMPASVKHDEESERMAKPRESAGQIRVDLFRVRCEGPVRRGVWGDMFKDHLNNGNSEAPETVNDVDVSHTAGFSEPKPLDKETVSTQSVSHLDPEGVVFASFIFFYRSERQLKKMGLVKPPAPARSLTAHNTPIKSVGKHDFSSLSSDNEVIPKGPDIFGRAKNGFGGFRERSATESGSRPRARKTIIDDDEEEDFNPDELGRDDKDMQREYTKTEEDIRLEEELSAGVNRVKLKRTHSTSSLKRGSNPSTPPATNDPPPGLTTTAETPKPPVHTEPETPAKRRRGSNDKDVKSPPPIQGTGGGVAPPIPQRGLTFGSTAEASMAAASFGGFLSGSGSAVMDEEEL